MGLDKIRDSIKELAKTDDEVYSVVCNVDSVDTAENTCKCTPIDGSADLLGVRLMAQNQTGFLIIPKINSVVVVTFINQFTGYIAMFSEVDSISLNGDNYDGLVKVGKLTDALNDLQNKVNTIISTYNTHTHVTTCGAGAGTAAVPPSQVIGTLTPTSQVDLENLTVSHGNG